MTVFPVPISSASRKAVLLTSRLTPSIWNGYSVPGRSDGRSRSSRKGGFKKRKQIMPNYGLRAVQWLTTLVFQRPLEAAIAPEDGAICS